MKQDVETSHKLPGVKISFEGIDGSGKTTQTLLVQNHLERMGYKVFRAPDNSDASEENLDGKILSILRKEKDRFFRIGHPVTENLLLASRAAFIDKTITLSKLKSGYVVLADRDVDTFIAYGIPNLQDAYPNKKPEELMDWMISIVSIGRIHPDLTILFKPNLNQFLSRATVGIYKTNQKDNFSLEDWKFMEKIATYYERLKEIFPERILVFDITNKNKQEILEELLHTIIPFLEKRNVPKKK
uniref:Thymidylate kinase n=1 Tax=candidate division CPR3 bacterium TaxID=2268181 RepID=A0A7C5URU6_UNCC3